MSIYSKPLSELREYNDVIDKLKKNISPIQITGCVECQKCQLISNLGENCLFKIVIAEDEIKAKTLFDDLRMYNKDVYLYPAKDIIFYNADIHGNAIVIERMQVIKRIIEKKPTTIVTTIEGGMDKLLPLQYIADSVIKIDQESKVIPDELSKKLVNMGYSRTTQVEDRGEFAIRGGIIDIYPLTEEVPYRIELWDDEIDTIRSFDIESQRSIEKVEAISIYPATEIILEDRVKQDGIARIDAEKSKQVDKFRSERKNEEANRLDNAIEEFKEKLSDYNGTMCIESFIGYFYDNTVSFFEYFSKENTICFVDEFARLEERGRAVEYEFSEGMAGRLEKGYILPGQIKVIYSFKEALAKLGRYSMITMSVMDYKINSINIVFKCDFTVRSVNTYNNNFEMLVSDLRKWKENRYRVVLVSNSRTRAKRLAGDLTDEGLNAIYSEDIDHDIKPREILITYGNLRRGFEYPLIKYAIISDSDIFGVSIKKKKKKRQYDGKKIQSFTDLNIGDYVVHENHGVGIYRGIEKIQVDGIVKDYIKIEYAAGGNLYILATGLDVIQKYAGADAKMPKINKLNSNEWKNTKTRVKSAVKDIAKELVELYAKRQAKQGHCFCEDTVWQHEFEEMFPYDETQDQLDAIDETKRDMESSKIMDRLICGDVGYGKTEIAIRAAFKAVSDGKQVAFLVPTTILAQQHYNTFSQRMMDFPISIDMLSRFRTAKQQKFALEKLKNGTLDIIIGTHRLLSKDVNFKNLGLLIVDEEQRFGVTHKEKIKQMKGDVDVLTLSATPIPRTLHMSLVGIRDMSVLEEPPIDRMPIQTYVLEKNDEIVREAINREIARGGQVYYVYNRVNTIIETANMISKLVPNANVAFAHGQMSERELENVMYAFINGEIDVLVSTTIVETGLDISNVNTMIIDDADRFGLSQLYQLRGRVGRSNRTAYAFLMYRRNKILREDAEKRLQAIKDFTELGSGFKIAMKDLEIRGAGNLLGAKQHGHMEAVGYDMYCKMLNEAVLELKGIDKKEEEFNTSIDLDVDAYIPLTYIKSEYQKLDMYKRIAEIKNDEEHLEIQDEMMDRFGDIPVCVNNLLTIAMLREQAHQCFIEQITQKDNRLRLILYSKAGIELNSIPLLLKEFKGILKFVPDQNPYFEYVLNRGKSNTIRKSDNLFNELKVLLNKIRELIII